MVGGANEEGDREIEKETAEQFQHRNSSNAHLQSPSSFGAPNPFSPSPWGHNPFPPGMGMGMGMMDPSQGSGNAMWGGNPSPPFQGGVPPGVMMAQGFWGQFQGGGNRGYPGPRIQNPGGPFYNNPPGAGPAGLNPAGFRGGPGYWGAGGADYGMFGGISPGGMGPPGMGFQSGMGPGGPAVPRPGGPGGGPGGLSRSASETVSPPPLPSGSSPSVSAPVATKAVGPPNKSVGAAAGAAFEGVTSNDAPQSERQANNRTSTEPAADSGRGVPSEDSRKRPRDADASPGIENTTSFSVPPFPPAPPAQSVSGPGPQRGTPGGPPGPSGGPLRSQMFRSARDFVRGKQRSAQNDYSQHYVDTGFRPQNFIRDMDIQDRFEEYPKLKELVARKDKLIADHSFPPMYLKMDLKTTELTAEMFGTKFDVILVDPPWEEYVRRSPGLTDGQEWWSVEEIMNLRIESIGDTPSFVFLWVGDAEGLEQGRACLKKWGYRRCEDICWIKTNREKPDDKWGHSTGTVLHHSKEHCLVGIKGTVRRSNDCHIIHANIDTDIIISEEPPYGSTDKPEETYRIIEHFSLGMRRLELFGGDRSIRNGWVTVGKDLTSSNFTSQAYVKMFVPNEATYMLHNRPSYPPPNAPHLIKTTPEIEALRPKSPVRNQQQHQPVQVLSLSQIPGCVAASQPGQAQGAVMPVSVPSSGPT